MNPRHMNWAIRRNKLKPHERLILIIMVNMTTKKEPLIYPTIQQLAEWGNMSERKVNYCLKRLLAIGYIRKEKKYFRKDGKRNIWKHNIYRVDVPEWVDKSKVKKQVGNVSYIENQNN
tara:strand:+ start:723 stop:1076 length:354 start_codon:yes stop_codon:yes gene_type:complete